MSHVNAVIEHIKGGDTLTNLSDVTDRLTHAFAGLAAGTINRRLSVLKASAKHAKRKRWISHNYSPDVTLLREPRYIRREVSPDMAQRLIQAASTPRAKALIAGSAYTGMRLSEVLRFDPAKDIQEGAIRVRDSTPGYEDRLIPILPELEPHLSQFPMDKTGWRNVYRGWLQARRKAGLQIRYHDLRHMVATAMVNAGYPDRVVADLLGHKSTATTRKYTHPSLAVKRQALSAVSQQIKNAKKAA